MATRSDSQLQVLASGISGSGESSHQQRRNSDDEEQPLELRQQDSQHLRKNLIHCVLLKYKTRVCKKYGFQSKGVRLLLLWNFIVAFAFESLMSTDPDSYLLPAVFGAIRKYKFSGAIYAANAFILLFYPLAGYLADVKYGRYKTVTRSLWVMFCSNMLAIMSLVVGVIFLDAFGAISRRSDLFYVLFGFSIPVMSGLIFFRANILQFGIDQLQDSPSEDSVFYILWYVWTGFGGKALAKIPFVFSGYFCGELGFYLIHAGGGILVIIFTLLLGTSLFASDLNRTWFTINKAATNPYRLVYAVVKFAFKHKNPIRRSAFTYCEDELPSRLDLGKEKYGGPFTTEQVEDVKALLGILLVLVTFGPIFALDSATTAQYHLAFSLQYYFGTCSSTNSNETYTINVVSRAGSLVPFFIVAFVPLYLFLLRPFVYNYIPGILKRMCLGAILLTLAIVCHLLIDVLGQTSSNCFLSSNSLGRYRSNATLNLVILPNLLNAVSYILILSGSYEYICCQSPHAMKGLLIGTFFAIKGFFQLCGGLLTYLPYKNWVPSSRLFPSCGFIYYLINIVVGVSGVTVYAIVARRYQYRQRDEPDHTYRYAEEYYDKLYENSTCDND